MKAKPLSQEQFKVFVDKALVKETRWNSSLDNDLWTSCVLNFNNKVYTQGITAKEAKTVNINGIPCVLSVLYNPYMVTSIGGAIAVCLTDTRSQIVVFVDDKFMSMTEASQEAIIQHELGHIANEHVAILGVRQVDIEVQADMYAVSKVGVDDVVNALLEIKGKLKGLMYWASRKELNKRIKVLKASK